MLGPIDYLLWISSFLLQSYIVVYSIIRGHFARYLSLNAYMLVVALVNVGQFYVIHFYGLSSTFYIYFYYYSDAMLVVFLYFAILGLYHHVFQEMAVSRYLRGGTFLLLAATAGFSYLVVQKNVSHLTSRFVVELGQNLYFVGMVLTYVLWGAVLQLRETRVRIIQLVLSLGIFFSVLAATYALRLMFPNLIDLFRWIKPVMGTFLPLAWAYAFSRFSEDTRIATARVATTR